MFHISQKISNVKLFKILNDEALTISNDNILEIHSCSYEIGRTPINNFEVFYNKIYLTDWNGNYTILNQNLEILESGVNKAFFHSSKFYLGHQFINGEGLIVDALISHDNQVINIGQLDKTVSINTSSSNQYFLILEKKIESFSLPQPRRLWTYDLNNLGKYSPIEFERKPSEVRQIIGLHLDRLFLYLKTREVIVLEITNGELVQQLTHIDELNGQSSIGWSEKEIPFFETNYILDEQREIILGLAIDLYYEVDVSKEVAHAKAYALTSEFNKHKINAQGVSKNNVYFEGHLYFLDKDQSRFGVLNTLTKEIVYVSDPIIALNRPDAWPQLKEIQVSKDKVYVLASDHTLHIFERTFN